MFQKNTKIKLSKLLIAIAFFTMIAIISMSFLCLLTKHNTISASIVEIPIPDPVERIDPEAFWNRFIGFVQKIAFPILGLMIGIAGLLFIISSGDPNKIRIAWKIIIFSFIGLLIILIIDPLARTVIEMLQK